MSLKASCLGVSNYVFKKVTEISLHFSPPDQKNKTQHCQALEIKEHGFL